MAESLLASVGENSIFWITISMVQIAQVKVTAPGLDSRTASIMKVARGGMDSLGKEMRDLGTARDHGNDSDSSSDSDHDSGGDGGDGGCFVTTACVEMRGMPDDCREMKRMRELRRYILGTRTGFQEIADYNSIGPALVRSIKAHPCCREIWACVFVWITTAADLVEVGNFASARGVYYGVIKFLRGQT